MQCNMLCMRRRSLVHRVALSNAANEVCKGAALMFTRSWVPDLVAYSFVMPWAFSYCIVRCCISVISNAQAISWECVGASFVGFAV
jgi:hypothetical protein